MVTDVIPPATEVAVRPGRPVPHPTALTAPFWDACREGQLLYQHCAECGVAIFPPQGFCPRDLSTRLDWQRSAGLGTVYSCTTVWRPQTPAFETPYVVAIVDLNEGYTMLSNIVDVDPSQVVIDMPVEVVFRAVSPAITAPMFVPRSS